MAMHKHKAEWISPPAAPAFTPDPRTAAATPSPARALQQLLDERTSAAVDPEQWSRRRQVAVIVVASCALWMAILTTTAQLVRAIA